jgi:hypothetical protein
MFRRIARLPINILKRAMGTLSGERDAPSPTPLRAAATPPAAPPSPKPVPAAKTKPKAIKRPKSKGAAKAPSIQVDAQETPNPNAMKFSLSITVAETGSFSFNATDKEIAHPIAAAVVALEGVVSVFGVNDFITVSKTAESDWATLIPAVVDAIKTAA